MKFSKIEINQHLRKLQNSSVIGMVKFVKRSGNSKKVNV